MKAVSAIKCTKSGRGCCKMNIQYFNVLQPMLHECIVSRVFKRNSIINSNAHTHTACTKKPNIFEARKEFPFE